MFNFYEREELKKELEKLRKENEELKKENEKLRVSVTNAAKRIEELWDALNVAVSQMWAFVTSSRMRYLGDNPQVGKMLLERWVNKFDEQYKASEDLMFHSEYRGIQQCGDKRYWFR